MEILARLQAAPAPFGEPPPVHHPVAIPQCHDYREQQREEDPVDKIDLPSD